MQRLINVHTVTEPKDRQPSASPLADPIQTALATLQHGLGEHTALVRKYQTAIAPFAALADDSPEALQELHSLMAPGEMCLYISNIAPPETPGLRLRGSFETVQMLWPEEQPIFPAELSSIDSLTCAQAPEMLELIAVAFPGLFREQTCRMGLYRGLRGVPGTSLEGKLIAMAGDRFCLNTPEGTEWREISGVCTHPEATGQGLATRLIASKLHEHCAAGVRSFLHAAADNVRAIGIYERLGFRHERRFTLQCVIRNQADAS